MSPQTPPIRVTFDEQRIHEIVEEYARPYLEQLAAVTAERAAQAARIDKALALCAGNHCGCATEVRRALTEDVP